MSCYGVLVLHLFKELVCGIFVAILLHLGKVALLWCHCSIHLSGEGTIGVTFLLKSQHTPCFPTLQTFNVLVPCVLGQKTSSGSLFEQKMITYKEQLHNSFYYCRTSKPADQRQQYQLWNLLSGSGSKDSHRTPLPPRLSLVQFSDKKVDVSALV